MEERRWKKEGRQRSSPKGWVAILSSYLSIHLVFQTESETLPIRRSRFLFQANVMEEREQYLGKKIRLMTIPPRKWRRNNRLRKFES